MASSSRDTAMEDVADNQRSNKRKGAAKHATVEVARQVVTENLLEDPPLPRRPPAGEDITADVRRLERIVAGFSKRMTMLAEHVRRLRDDLDDAELVSNQYHVKQFVMVFDDNQWLNGIQEQVATHAERIHVCRDNPEGNAELKECTKFWMTVSNPREVMISETYPQMEKAEARGERRTAYFGQNNAPVFN